MRKSLGIAREFASEDAKQFVKNGLGQKQLVFLFEIRCSAASPRPPGNTSAETSMLVSKTTFNG